MSNHNYSIIYPRRRLIRSILRTFVKFIFPIFFKLSLEGKENFPKSGPLIVVGNHPAAVEVVLMAAYTPWQVEPLGAGDIPQEKIIQIVESLYGQIPIRRGYVNRKSLQNAVDALKQNGVIGIFPEGGVWNSGEEGTHSGVSWLSDRANAPILPIGYGGTTGALTKAIKLKHPTITMHVGKLIPPVSVVPGISRKVCFAEHSKKVMHAVNDLIPANDPSLNANIRDERFELEINVLNAQLDKQSIPKNFKISNPEILAKFLHSPMILYIFSRNLKIPNLSLEQLNTRPRAIDIVIATSSIIEILNTDYPYLLSYRVGNKTAGLIKLSLIELNQIAQWVDDTNLILEIVPIRYYYAIDLAKEIKQINQEFLESWM